MIFYFSGTGNSLYAAKRLAQYHNEELVSISTEVNSEKEVHEYNLKANEVIGFVFPVYAWGPPTMVSDFIEKIKLYNYQKNYVFAVATCGDNIGNTMEVLEERLRKIGIELNSGFSLIMPNNYIILGDVDSKEVARKKLLAAEEVLKMINHTVEERKVGEFKVKKGFFPWLLSGFVNKMFIKNASNTTKFYADANCIGCGVCEKVCNCKNIIVKDKPQWGKRCIQCLACIHYCPQKAIQYGKGTVKKGRYTNPHVMLKK